ncbi:ABC transporter permease [Jatrophihabitans sp.]|uniref:ABC transporter permease n=1 Tax=Jatrophihabitans sp. TaxID=1932789 RepID=UPI0030C737DA|nr:hypothetical protein [Jatrophihabitans sp.]
MTDTLARLETAPAPVAELTRRPFTHSTAIVLGWELEKLTAQLRTRGAFAVALLGPFAFVLSVSASGTLPADTLFGRYVLTSGFATPLVVLGFAASWGFPLLTCVVAGDIFSAEDHHGTWKTLLTRSCSRASIFTGKALAVVVYTVSVLAVLTCSSLAAGLVVEGKQPLIGLSGNLIASGRATELVLLAWLTVLPPALAFAAIGMLASIVSRNSLVGILGSVALGLAMQFGGLIDGAEPLRRGLLGTQFLAWHGLFEEPGYTGAITEDVLVSAAYLAVCGTAAWLVLRRRDITGG